jgi:hypothetical protein
MKNIPLAALALAAIALTGGAPVLAEKASPVPAVHAQAAASDSASDARASYSQKTRAEVLEWRDKLDRLSESSKASSREAWKSASEDLNASWIKTKEASARLEALGSASWSSAKISYQQASDALAAKWAKVRADAK